MLAVSTCQVFSAQHSSYVPCTTKLKQQFDEYIEWAYSATLQRKDKQFVQEAFDKALINLAFCHAVLEEKERMAKGEAVRHFLKSYNQQISIQFVTGGKRT